MESAVIWDWETDMPTTDTLLSLAEISAAFAGFAALVSALKRSSDRAGEAIHDLLRLRLVISSAVAGVVAALLPVGLAGFGIDSSLLWRLAAGAFLVCDNGVIISFARAYSPVRRVIEPDQLAVAVVSILELVEQSCLIVVVVAALNLVMDFDFIENGAERGAPKYMEWYGAFGLIVTLAWLYLEMLRLLMKLNSRR